MASARVAYQGYAESNADLGLPALPDIGDISSLLDGSTDQYAWYRSADQWRADVLTTAGETDTYQYGDLSTFEWDYGSNMLTQIVGTEPVRLPRAADLLPPELGRRLLSYAGKHARVSVLPGLRVGGVDAAGIRLETPSAATIVTAVDIWADPRTGLPLEVQVFCRGQAAPVLVSQFLEVSFAQPSVATITPPEPGPTTGFDIAGLPDVERILHGYGPPLPASLGGTSRAAGVAGLPDVAAYGSGFGRFAVIPLPRGAGATVLQAATAAGTTVQLGSGTAVVIQTPLLTVLLAPTLGGPVYLLTGTVTAATLERAALQLPDNA